MTTQTVEHDVEFYRGEITGYCYRMLGSVFEADDAAQETMVRAWKSIDRFEGRSSLRTWLYRIATNICLDALRGRARKDRPMDMGPSSPPDISHLGPQLIDHPWLLPMPDALIDPATVAVGRESVRLAFVAALQHLPARQRAVLILCQVLSWPAVDVAELLDTSTASVNSALQRARATMESLDLGLSPLDASTPDLAADQQQLLDSFVKAFEDYDMDRLALLLRDDVVQNMPPFALWLEGPGSVVTWMLGAGAECEGSRMLPTRANGCAAFGQYRRAETFDDPELAAMGGHLPWALQVIELRGGLISGITSFLGDELFSAFGLPAHLPAAS
ncbi:MAG TPA: sigma-70 family RNA polymerase sigma factor [Acidimicrobiales bacterium]|nr:sigma-70 family RNA polymerase sigma factor [Acidimicrobiales bacterium]